MKTNHECVQKYRYAYDEMRKQAIEVMKNYGKVLNVYEVLKARILKEQGLDKMPEVGTEEYDAFCEDYDEQKYSCVFEGKHEQVYIANIAMVRYNEEIKDVDVYLESDDGYISQWMPMLYIGYEQEAVYMTILDFIEE